LNPGTGGQTNKNKYTLPISSLDHQIKYDTTALLHDNLLYPLEVFENDKGMEIEINLNSSNFISDWPILVILHNYSNEANKAFSALDGATEGEMIEQKRED